jgi:hypothetical protein
VVEVPERVTMSWAVRGEGRVGEIVRRTYISLTPSCRLGR